MRKELPAEKLAEVWQTIQAQAGAYQSVSETRIEEMGQANIVILTTRFAQALLDIRITFNHQRESVDCILCRQKDRPLPIRHRTMHCLRISLKLR